MSTVRVASLAICAFLFAGWCGAQENATAYPPEAQPAQPAPQPKKKKKKKNGKDLPPPIVEPTAEVAERTALEKARQKVEVEKRIQKDIRRLTTSGYLEAENDLIEVGAPAVPFLIEA